MIPSQSTSSIKTAVTTKSFITKTKFRASGSPKPVIASKAVISSGPKVQKEEKHQESFMSGSQTSRVPNMQKFAVTGMGSPRMKRKPPVPKFDPS